jgi:hypothetical protein
MNWKNWLYTLIAGGVGGFASAGLSILAMPDAFNFSAAGWQHIWKALLIGAGVPILTFLKQSPLPSESQTVTATVTTTATK